MAEEVFDNRIVTIPGLKGRDSKEISEKNLARIIQARVEEILDYVLWEIRRAGFDRKLVGGIVLTGGGALLKHIEKLAEYHTGMGTRIGFPVEHLGHGYSEQISSPVFATSIGLLMQGIEDVESGKIRYASKEKKSEEAPVQEVEEAKNGGWLENIFKKTREWFEAEPDTEF